MTPLVSILIPAYNAEPWIADAIMSALAQTWPRKEVIVVDDGSLDRTFSIARQFASASVRVITQENAGASAARNRAFQLCQGDYIQWLDADDLLGPEKVTEQMNAVQRSHDNRLLFSAPWASFMYRMSKAQFYPTALWRDLEPREWLLLKMSQNLHMQTATWLVSRELTEMAGPWDTRLSLDDDGEYFCRVLLASSGVRFVAGARVFYRATGSARLSKIDLSRKKLESQLLSMKLHVDYLRSLEESERVRAACVSYLQTWFIWFHEENPELAEELRDLARQIGGELHIPALRAKYRWIERLFGHRTAKRVQFLLPGLKWNVIRQWEKAMYKCEQHRTANA
jgi:glycosyltransferase involved in cell wall biosynthesis